MDNQILVGVMHGGAYDLEQSEAGGNIEPMLVAIGIDGDAIDILHDDVSCAVRQRAAVQQMRDIRMIQLREDLPLDLEAGFHPAPLSAAPPHFYFQLHLAT